MSSRGKDEPQKHCSTEVKEEKKDKAMSGGDYANSGARPKHTTQLDREVDYRRGLMKESWCHVEGKKEQSDSRIDGFMKDGRSESTSTRLTWMSNPTLLQPIPQELSTDFEERQHTEFLRNQNRFRDVKVYTSGVETATDPYTAEFEEQEPFGMEDPAKSAETAGAIQSFGTKSSHRDSPDFQPFEQIKPDQMSQQRKEETNRGISYETEDFIQIKYVRDATTVSQICSGMSKDNVRSRRLRNVTKYLRNEATPAAETDNPGLTREKRLDAKKTNVFPADGKASLVEIIEDPNGAVKYRRTPFEPEYQPLESRITRFHLGTRTSKKPEELGTSRTRTEGDKWTDMIPEQSENVENCEWENEKAVKNREEENEGEKQEKTKMQRKEDKIVTKEEEAEEEDDDEEEAEDEAVHEADADKTVKKMAYYQRKEDREHKRKEREDEEERHRKISQKLMNMHSDYSDRLKGTGNGATCVSKTTTAFQSVRSQVDQFKMDFRRLAMMKERSPTSLQENAPNYVAESSAFDDDDDVDEKEKPPEVDAFPLSLHDRPERDWTGHREQTRSATTPDQAAGCSRYVIKQYVTPEMMRGRRFSFHDSASGSRFSSYTFPLNQVPTASSADLQTPGQPQQLNQFMPIEDMADAAVHGLITDDLPTIAVLQTPAQPQQQQQQGNQLMPVGDMTDAAAQAPEESRMRRIARSPERSSAVIQRSRAKPHPCDNFLARWAPEIKSTDLILMCLLITLFFLVVDFCPAYSSPGLFADYLDYLNRSEEAEKGNTEQSDAKNN